MEAARKQNPLQTSFRIRRPDLPIEQREPRYRRKPTGPDHTREGVSIYSIIPKLTALSEMQCTSKMESVVNSGREFPDIENIVDGLAKLYPLVCTANNIVINVPSRNLNQFEKAAWYYEKFSKMVSSDVLLNIEYDIDNQEKKLYDQPFLVYYKPVKYEDSTLYTIPLEILPFIEKENPAVFNILINVFANIQTKWFEGDIENNHYAWIKEMFKSGEGAEYMDELDDDDPQKIDYLTGNNIYNSVVPKYFELVDTTDTEPLNQTLDKLDNLILTGKWYKKLRTILRETISVLTLPNALYCFEYDPNKDHDDDDYQDPISLWSQFLFVWSTDDWVYAQFEQDVNTDFGEFGAQTLNWTNVVSNNKPKILAYDDFAEKAVSVLSSLSKHLEDYLEKHRTKK